jgi:hypothetical protein
MTHVIGNANIALNLVTPLWVTYANKIVCVQYVTNGASLKSTRTQVLCNDMYV